MCTPLVIPAIVGGAVNIASSVVSGEAASKQAKANQELAEKQRIMALQQGVAQAARIGAEGRRVQSSALAAMGASGIDTASGSDPMALSAVNIALDQEQAKANAALRAWGFEAEELDYHRQRAVAGLTTGFGVAGGVLGAGGGIASALSKGSE